jgi:hypothetical protein
MKKILSLALIIVFALSLQTACTDSGGNAPSGNVSDGVYVSVNNDKETITFNGAEITIASGFTDPTTGTFEIKGDTISITMDLFGEKVTEDRSFKIEGDSVFLDDIEYVKE